MRWSLRIGRIRGVGLYVHFSFFFLLLFVGLAQASTRDVAAGLRGTLLVSLIFLSVLLHEWAHSYVSERQGLRVRAVTLFPFGGLATLEGLPRSSRQEVSIALAGPLANFLLAAALAVALNRLDPAMDFTRPILAGEEILPSLFWANIYLGLLNLVPAYPLDGGRVLRGLLLARMDYFQATHKVALVGQLFAFLFVFLGLFYTWWLILVGLFVYAAAVSEERLTLFQSVLEHIRLEDVMLTDFQALSPAASLGDALDRALHSLQDDFPVVREGVVLGVLSRSAMLAAIQREGLNYSVQATMSREFESADRRDTLASAFRKFGARRMSMIPVLDGGQLVGIITLQNLLHNIALLSEKTDFGSPDRPDR